MGLTAFSQRDPRWADIRLGLSGQETIGLAGCLMTCVASLVRDIAGLDTDPGRLNRWLARNGGYLDGNLFVFASVAKLGLKLKDVVPCMQTAAPVGRITETLAAGGGVLVKVDFDPGGAIQQHWVRVLELKADDAVVMDPWLPPGNEVYWLMPRYAIPAWPDPATAILHIALYERGNTPEADATQVRLSIRGW